MRPLVESDVELLHEEICDRFEDAEVHWPKVLASPHYLPLIKAARRGAWSLVSMMLQEIWEGTDR